MQPFPATPLDIEMYSWQFIGAGDTSPCVRAEFSKHLDEQRLDTALRLLIAAEPVLGCRLVVDAEVPHWQPLEELPATVVTFTLDESECEHLSSASPEPTLGPQISALLWRSAESDVLTLKISHASGDGGSVFYCLERLAEIYTRLLDDPAYVPTENTARRDLDQIKELVPKRSYLGVVRDWMRFAFAFSWPKATQHIGLPTGEDSPWHYVTRQVSAERVSSLSQYGRTRGATLNDIFLAAHYRTIAVQGHWDGKAALRTLLTIDLRPWFLPNTRANAVANLSSAELPFLGRKLGSTFDETLARVVKSTNKRKRRNPGLAVALLTPKIEKGGLTEKRLDRTRERFKGAGVPVFTNVGRIEGERLSFAGQTPSQVTFLSMKPKLPRLVVGLSGYNGSLTLSLAAADIARPQFEAFLDGMLAELPA